MLVTIGALRFTGNDTGMELHSSGLLVVVVSS